MKKSEVNGSSDFFIKLEQKMIDKGIPVRITDKGVSVRYGKLTSGPCRNTDNYFFTWTFNHPFECVVDFFNKYFGKPNE